MSRLALYLLGSPRIDLDSEEIHIGQRKALALLAYLAVTGGCHQRDSLATLLWLDLAAFHARLAESEAHGHAAGQACAGCVRAL